MTHRFNVNFSDSAWDVVDDLSRELQIDRGEVLRQALSHYWWTAREVKANSIFLIVREGDGWPTETTFGGLERLRPPEPPKRPGIRDRLRQWFADVEIIRPVADRTTKESIDA